MKKTVINDFNKYHNLLHNYMYIHMSPQLIWGKKIKHLKIEKIKSLLEV